MPLPLRTCPDALSAPLQPAPHCMVGICLCPSWREVCSHGLVMCWCRPRGQHCCVDAGALRVPGPERAQWVVIQCERGWTRAGGQLTLLLPGITSSTQSLAFFFFFFFDQEANRQLMFKRPGWTPQWVQQRAFKGNLGKSVLGYVISLCTILWLIDEEVTRESQPSPSGSKQSEFYMLVGSI